MTAVILEEEVIDGLGASGGGGLRKEEGCFASKRRRVGPVIINFSHF